MSSVRTRSRGLLGNPSMRFAPGYFLAFSRSDATGSPLSTSRQPEPIGRVGKRKRHPPIAGWRWWVALPLTHPTRSQQETRARQSIDGIRAGLLPGLGLFPLGGLGQDGLGVLLEQVAAARTADV